MTLKDTVKHGLQRAALDGRLLFWACRFACAQISNGALIVENSSGRIERPLSLGDIVFVLQTGMHRVEIVMAMIRALHHIHPIADSRDPQYEEAHALMSLALLWHRGDANLSTLALSCPSPVEESSMLRPWLAVLEPKLSLLGKTLPWSESGGRVTSIAQLQEFLCSDEWQQYSRALSHGPIALYSCVPDWNFPALVYRKAVFSHVSVCTAIEEVIEMLWVKEYGNEMKKRLSDVFAHDSETLEVLLAMAGCEAHAHSRLVLREVWHALATRFSSSIPSDTPSMVVYMFPKRIVEALSSAFITSHVDILRDVITCVRNLKETQVILADLLVDTHIVSLISSALSRHRWWASELGSQGLCELEELAGGPWVCRESRVLTVGFNDKTEPALFHHQGFPTRLYYRLLDVPVDARVASVTATVSAKDQGGGNSGHAHVNLVILDACGSVKCSERLLTAGHNLVTGTHSLSACLLETIRPGDKIGITVVSPYYPGWCCQVTKVEMAITIVEATEDS